MVRGSRVAVVVMGDLARSPRMVNHARELAANGFSPVLIGYRGRSFTPPSGVRVVRLEGGQSAPRDRKGVRFALGAGLRMSRLFFALAGALLREKPRTILLQNPPSFPTLTAATLTAKWLDSNVVVDWHNYGFSLLALRLGKSHWLVRLARWYEFRAGRKAMTHICVSTAMQEDLLRHGIRADVLYDKPGAVYKHVSVAVPTVALMAVCPAGWTADEDIELLLDALPLLPAPNVAVFITGEGPKREEFAPRLQALRARGILVDTGFLAEADYRTLMQRADLGLSLHRSSSGLDLAMKVVDLFSAGVPVCALDYGVCIREQIEEKETGFLFHTAQDLARLLTRLAAEPETLSALRSRIQERWTASWGEEWQRVLLPDPGRKLWEDPEF